MNLLVEASATFECTLEAEEGREGGGALPSAGVYKTSQTSVTFVKTMNQVVAAA